MKSTQIEVTKKLLEINTIKISSSKPIYLGIGLEIAYLLRQPKDFIISRNTYLYPRQVCECNQGKISGG